MQMDAFSQAINAHILHRMEDEPRGVEINLLQRAEPGEKNPHTRFDTASVKQSGYFDF